MAEIAAAASSLKAPAALLIARGAQRPLALAEVEQLIHSGTVIVDACRRVVRGGEAIVSLARRPVLFALARALAEAWPHDVSRNVLVARAFRGDGPTNPIGRDCVLEIGRLRRSLRGIAGIHATDAGFALVMQRRTEVAVLEVPFEGDNAALLALLSDGESWSSSALGMALGASQRSVQRGFGLAGESRQGPAIRAWAGASLDRASAGWNHDDTVTPRQLPDRLKSNS